MKAGVRCMLAGLFALAVASGALAGPSDAQASQQQQTVTGTITKVIVKGQMIHVQPLPEMQIQTQQTLPGKKGKTDSKGGVLAFQIDKGTEIISDVPVKGKGKGKAGPGGKQKGLAPTGKQKGDQQASPGKTEQEGKEQATPDAGKTEPGQDQAGPGKTQQGEAAASAQFDMLQVGQVVEVAFVAGQAIPGAKGIFQGPVKGKGKQGQSGKQGTVIVDQGQSGKQGTVIVDQGQSGKQGQGQFGKVPPIQGQSGKQGTIQQGQWGKGKQGQYQKSLSGETAGVFRAARVRILPSMGQPVPGLQPQPPAPPAPAPATPDAPAAAPASGDSN